MGAFDRVWDRIERCDRCLRDPRLDLLRRESFVPHRPISPMPPGSKRIKYLFVAMESSLDWANGSRTRALDLQKRGWRCFNNSPEDLTFHYAAQRWLVGANDGYAITDLGKCALPVAVAKKTNAQRYANCLPWLEEEIRVLRPALLIAVGRPALDHAAELRSDAWPPLVGVMHWSRQNQMNVHRYAFAGASDGLPTDAAFIRWRIRAFETRSWHPPGDPREYRARNVTTFQKQLLAIYRRQFRAVRAFARNPNAATRQQARQVGVRIA